MKSTAVQHYGADPATGIIEPGRRLVVSGRHVENHQAMYM